MKKILKAAVLTLLVAVAVDLVFILIHANRSASDGADAVIILGAKLYGSVPAPSLANRIEVAAEYLKRNPNAVVVGTGGRGADEEIAEGEAIRRSLVALGIREERILVEAQSVSTRENLDFAMELLKGRIPDRNAEIVIATNSYHLCRAKMLAEKIAAEKGRSDWTFEGLPAETPKSVVLFSYLREMLALPKDWLLNMIL